MKFRIGTQRVTLLLLLLLGLVSGSHGASPALHEQAGLGERSLQFRVVSFGELDMTLQFLTDGTGAVATIDLYTMDHAHIGGFEFAVGSPSWTSLVAHGGAEHRIVIRQFTGTIATLGWSLPEGCPAGCIGVASFQGGIETHRLTIRSGDPGATFFIDQASLSTLYAEEVHEQDTRVSLRAGGLRAEAVVGGGYAFRTEAPSIARIAPEVLRPLGLREVTLVSSTMQITCPCMFLDELLPPGEYVIEVEAASVERFPSYLLAVTEVSGPGWRSWA